MTVEAASVLQHLLFTTDFMLQDIINAPPYSTYSSPPKAYWLM